MKQVRWLSFIPGLRTVTFILGLCPFELKNCMASDLWRFLSRTNVDWKAAQTGRLAHFSLQNCINLDSQSCFFSPLSCIWSHVYGQWWCFHQRLTEEDKDFNISPFFFFFITFRLLIRFLTSNVSAFRWRIFLQNNLRNISKFCVVCSSINRSSENPEESNEQTKILQFPRKKVWKEIPSEDRYLVCLESRFWF